MKISPVGGELVNEDERTDGRTDITKLIIAFHSSANAPTDSRKTVSKAIRKLLRGVNRKAFHEYKDSAP